MIQCLSIKQLCETLINKLSCELPKQVGIQMLHLPQPRGCAAISLVRALSLKLSSLLIQREEWVSRAVVERRNRFPRLQARKTISLKSHSLPLFRDSKHFEPIGHTWWQKKPLKSGPCPYKKVRRCFYAAKIQKFWYVFLFDEKISKKNRDAAPTTSL